jgi:hypothetical protein
VVKATLGFAVVAEFVLVVPNTDTPEYSDTAAVMFANVLRVTVTDVIPADTALALHISTLTVLLIASNLETRRKNDAPAAVTFETVEAGGEISTPSMLMDTTTTRSFPLAVDGMVTDKEVPATLRTALP